MAGFLDDEWLAELEAALVGLGVRGSGSGVVQFVVTGVPERKKVQFHVRAEDGAVREVRPGVDGRPSCVVTLDHAVAVAELSGAADPDVSFMSGAKKVEGEYAVYLLELQPLMGDAVARRALAELAARTTDG
jgi:hypothetical protein